ncbi:cation:proton antiporter [Glaciibacter flavus]|uniref:cation:proton antiporter n=1 Tax=Orlajensenia flava TaxID=2565934 RepID=UPI003B0046C6
MDWLIIGVLGVLAIVAASQASTRMRVATPLLLVVLGTGISLLPFTPDVPIEPEWILAGVLPPLLYSAGVSMPTMDFRRDFGAIAGLSVVLVVLTSAVLGLLFWWLIPGLGLAGGIALGAIVSPTDAVATTIVKRLGVSPRIVAVLEGESLLNDATALVLLRTAIVATAAAVSFWGVIGTFLYSVAVAVAIGLVVGWLNLRLRSKVRESAVNTAISFTVPFIAAIPAEYLGASGLVAAVTAGLITGSGAAKWLSPTHRLSDSQNWRLVELLLEGAVFLVMGLELSVILSDVQTDGGAGLGVAAGIALVALVVTVAVRAAYVFPLLRGLRRSAERKAERKDGLASIQTRLDGLVAAQSTDGPRAIAASPSAADGVAGDSTNFSQTDAVASAPRQRPTRAERRAGRQLAPASPESIQAQGKRVRRTVKPEDVQRFQQRAVRYVADVAYLQGEPLGWREGSVVVWAGMRGVVTLAAAQTLPADTPSRSLLVLIAFLVAAASLLIQGGTLGYVATKLGLTGVRTNMEERQRLSDELRVAAKAALDESGIDLRREGRLIVGQGESSTDGGGDGGQSGTGGGGREADSEVVGDSVKEADVEGGNRSSKDGGRSEGGDGSESGDGRGDDVRNGGVGDEGGSEVGAEGGEVVTGGEGGESGDGDVPTPSVDFEKFRVARLLMIEAQRSRLLELQKAGTYSSGALSWALESLDADQISIEVRSVDA